jgi:hypothetical protein
MQSSFALRTVFKTNAMPVWSSNKRKIIDRFHIVSILKGKIYFL